jgi:hypothetical protein
LKYTIRYDLCNAIADSGLVRTIYFNMVTVHSRKGV